MEKLSILGGSPLIKTETRSWPVYGQPERAALKNVLERGAWGTLGREAERFADLFSAWCGCAYGICTCNGAVSLEIILRALDIGWGDEVILPAYTSPSILASVVTTGAFPLLADIDPQTYAIDPDQISSLVTERTRAVIVTHLGGQISGMDQLLDICARKNLKLIEDAAQAPGSKWDGRYAGSLADAAAFNFSGDSVLTCGEGGFIATGDQSLYKACWSHHNAGRSYDTASEFGGTILIGTNARMAEWEAAILGCQLLRLESQIDQREKGAAALTEMTQEFPFLGTRRRDALAERDACHFFIWQYNHSFLDISRDTFVKALQAEGIPVRRGYGALHHSPALFGESFARTTGRNFEKSSLQLPNTEKAGKEEAIFLPGWFLLDPDQLDLAADAVEKLVSQSDQLRLFEQQG